MVGGYCSAECTPCRAWYDLHNKLHEALGLPPCQWLCLPRNPNPPGSALSRSWRSDPDSERLALWRLLDGARRARRRPQSATATA